MYIKVKDRKLFKELDENLTIPEKWREFVKEKSKNHNLILKSKNEYYCTCCKTTFKADYSINSYCKCNCCKRELLVKSARIKTYSFKDYLCIFDRYKNYYIERVFQLKTEYNNGNLNSEICEFGRTIYDDAFMQVERIVNENCVSTPSGTWIRKNNTTFDYKWRYPSYYNPLHYIDEFIYYPYNIKNIIGTIEKYKYSQIWTLLEHVEYCDLIYLLKCYNSSVELLTKMKMYNLALNPKTFQKKRTFWDRFYGLSKDYFPFIVENNLTLDELEILSVIKDRNIEDIKKLVKLHNYKDLSKYIDLQKAIKIKNLNTNNTNEYYDYLKMAKTLGMDLKNKQIAYPKNIKEAHDKILEQYNISKNKIISKKIFKIAKNIKSSEYQDNKYVIFPAKSYEDLVEESKQQNNCVRTYAERIVEGECYIYFMRKLSDLNKSLVTVEVRDNTVVQKRTKNNEITTKEQDKFLQKWELLKLKNG